MAVLSNIMLLLTLILLFFHFLPCSSQEFVEDIICEDKGNCDDLEASRCIGQYSQLDLYILNNKTLLRIFTETFFKTGERASQFVKFTYRFRISNGNIDSGDDPSNCTNHNTTYVWSKSALYLLGPRPLFWLTLLAVNVPEASATIDLPCLCSHAYTNLLARLTYLVCELIAIL